MELVKNLLAVSQQGGMVPDPFMGGSTTALACLANGRRFTWVELPPEYAALAADRIRHAEAAIKEGGRFAGRRVE